MARWRWYIAVGTLLLPALLTAVALAGGGRAVDWTSVAPLSAAARERANRQAAGRDAARLLTRVVLPASATLSPVNPAGGDRPLSQPGEAPAGVKLIDRHARWTVAEPISAVDAFLRAHVPAGARLNGSGAGGRPASASVTFAFPPLGRVLGIRWLVVSMVSLSSDTTALRADAEVQWIQPRPTTERIPRSVRVLEVSVGAPGSAPSTRAIVVSRARVWQIAADINGLEITQAGVWSCPSWSPDAPVVTFTFRRAPDGPVVARATELAAATEPTTPCDPMTLTIEGRRWHPLLGGAAVVRTAQRLLGVRLAR
jgi:hypothetical protein